MCRIARYVHLVASSRFLMEIHVNIRTLIPHFPCFYLFLVITGSIVDPSTIL